MQGAACFGLAARELSLHSISLGSGWVLMLILTVKLGVALSLGWLSSPPSRNPARLRSSGAGFWLCWPHVPAAETAYNRLERPSDEPRNSLLVQSLRGSRDKNEQSQAAREHQ